MCASWWLLGARTPRSGRNGFRTSDPRGYIDRSARRGWGSTGGSGRMPTVSIATRRGSPATSSGSPGSSGTSRTSSGDSTPSSCLRSPRVVPWSCSRRAGRRPRDLHPRGPEAAEEPDLFRLLPRDRPAMTLPRPSWPTSPMRARTAERVAHARQVVGEHATPGAIRATGPRRSATRSGCIVP